MIKLQLLLERPKARSPYMGTMNGMETMDNQHTLEIDLSWLAATIEGEGCITICKASNSNRLIPQINWANTNPDFASAVVKVLDRIGAANHVTRRQAKNERCKPAYHIVCAGQRSVETILCAVRPYMRSKVGQLELTLRFIGSRASRIKVTGYSHTPYNEEELGWLGEIRLLNQKGVRDCTLDAGQLAQETVQA